MIIFTNLPTASALLGTLATIGAGFNGASFLDDGHDFSSLIMAALWAVALASFAAGPLLAGATAPSAPRRHE